MEWLKTALKKPDDKTDDKKDDTGKTDEDETGFAYYPLDDGTYGVGVGELSERETLIIPSGYKGKAVTRIVYEGFKNCRAQSVTIPDSVTLIDENAFAECARLTSVNFGSGVKTIGKKAFTRCRALTEISIPDNVSVRRQCICRLLRS